MIDLFLLTEWYSTYGMGYPTCLSFFCKRLSGFSASTRQIFPLSSVTIGPSTPVSFELPPNVIVDLRSFQIKYNASTTGTVTAPGAVLLPKHAGDVMFDSYRVTANGVNITSVPPMSSTIYKAMADYTIGQTRANTRNVAQGQIMGYVGAVGSTSLFNEATGANGAIIAPGGLETNRPLIASNFLGLLGTIEPPCIPLQAIGNVRIDFQTAPAAVLYQTGAVNASYTLTNVYATVDCYSIQDGLFMDLLAKRLQEGALELPYQSITYYQGAQTGWTQTSKLQVNLPSVDMLMGWMLPANYASGALSPNTRSSIFFDRGAGAQGPNSSQFSVNNQLISFPANGLECWSQVMKVFNLDDTASCGTDQYLASYPQFLSSFFCHPIRLDLDCADSARMLSGTDSRAAGGFQIGWQTTATAGDATQGYPVLVVIGKNVLHVSAGRQIVIE